jgi:urease subunit gamma
VAAGLARERRGRGLRLNYPEATAMIAAYVLEGARDGRSVADLMEAGRHVLTADDVMEAVTGLLARLGPEAAAVAAGAARAADHGPAAARRPWSRPCARYCGRRWPSPW